MTDNTETSGQGVARRAGDRRGREDAPRRPDQAAGPGFVRRRPAAAEDGEGIDVRELLNVVRRRYPVILGTVVLVMALAAVYVSQLVPRYAAESWVMLDTRHVKLGLEDMMSGIEVDGAVVRSEMDLIKSYPLAAKVAKQLQLESVPEFNSSLRRPSFGDYLRHPVGFLKEQLHRLLGGSRAPAAAARRTDGKLAGAFDLFPPPAATAASAPSDDPDSGIIWSLMGHVSVSTDGRSYLLRIRAESESPMLAAKIANTYADTYLLDQLELKYAAVRRTSAWLNEHMTELRDKLNQSENAVEQFKQQHHITETRAGTVTAQQLTEINTQLITAAAERAQKEASLRELQGQLRAGQMPTSVLVSAPLLQSLRQQQAALMQQQAELATRYKPEHPVMVKLHAEIADLAGKIKEETEKAEAGLASDVAVARAREAALRDTLAGLQQSTDQQDQASIQLRELEREAAANKVLYENFLSKFKQTSAQEDIQQPDARLVAPAIPPGGPYFPNRSMLMSMALVISAIVGLALAFALEYLDDGYRTGEQVEQDLGVRALGLVPNVSGADTPHSMIVAQPKALYSEAVRSVRTALRYTNLARPPKLVLVTSSLPGEGKTVMALSLARSVARSGGKALLVDCDLRRPGIARLTGCGTARNLLDLFDGAEPETLINRDSGSGADVVTVKGGTANPQDALGSERMQSFLEAMRGRYDLIVLDAPPTLVVNDPIVLSHFVDATVFLVRWEKSSRKSVRQGLQRLRADGANVVGAVISRVNPKKHARYGYSDSAYYYYYSDYAEGEIPAQARDTP
jgi:polysaccharide biosynthesis transport protein